jgi:Domain of unknown function (DUF4270)
VKNRQILSSFIAIIAAIAIVLPACRKINDSTELGGGLIPPIDNITTFETFLDIESDNKIFNDTTKVLFNDELALGHISSDPEFGGTHADAYFNIVPANTFFNPFTDKDSVVAIDSVVLSLSYQGSFGDTNSVQTVRVFEIAQSSDFNDTTIYKYSHPVFTTTGPQLGAKTFQINKLKDSILHIRKKDTTKLANVIRIPLINQLGDRFKLYDTTKTANGGFRNDSIFKKLFKGLAIVADPSGNALTYFSPTDNAKSKLTIYFRVKRPANVIDTTSTDFYHLADGQANLVRRTPGGGWNAYLNNGIPNDDKIYLQSTPGSYAELKIPGLSTFNNAVIHRAEIIANPLRNASEGTFPQPIALYLDKINNANDTALSFDNDMSLSWNGDIRNPFAFDLGRFGGLLQTDSTYHFNISRYIQSLVTNKSTNYTMRLYSPVRAFVYSPVYKAKNLLYVADRVADGRVILAGGSYAAAPAKRLRLRIVYSKL